MLVTVKHERKTIVNIDETNKHTVVLGHMLPHWHKQRFYKWAWQGGTKKTKTWHTQKNTYKYKTKTISVKCQVSTHHSRQFLAIKTLLYERIEIAAASSNTFLHWEVGKEMPDWIKFTQLRKEDKETGR